MENRTTDLITELKPHEIFVFGSNYSGKHGKGAALTAKLKFGAVEGIGEGLQGQSYGIPTKAYDMRGRLSLIQIEKHVIEFINYVKKCPHLIFLVTEIGCGLAGYKPEQIAPLFKEAINIENIYLPHKFWTSLDNI